MNFPPSFLEELRQRVSLSEIIGKQVKLTRRGHEFTGLCPFHNEKTPSFTINEDKGFYHCFGCGAHGDAIKYLTDHDKMPFTDAVETLAARAGLALPQTSPKEAARAHRHNALGQIMEEACRFFEENLFSPGGADARAYLKSRGLTGRIAKTFRLGYAPNGSGLWKHLEAKGFSFSDCRNLGLVGKNTQTGRVYDYFYDRVMFPILDRRRRVIGFGGRLMHKGEPKYLNSPETELFHKGEQLYALGQAIDAMRKKNEAILVEGYMDVISLHAAGFSNAVAPLGTAFTEQQLKLLWQACDEPLICFDGDFAGQKAAMRALNRALPILTPGKSLRFVLLPEGFDPDDMIRKRSPEAFRQALNGAKSMTAMLWRLLLENRPIDTPERLAKLEKDIDETLGQIADKTVQSYYRKDFKKRLWALQRRDKKPLAPLSPAITAPSPASAAGRFLLACGVCFPHVLRRHWDDLCALQIPQKGLGGAWDDLAAFFLETPPEEMPDRLREIPPRVQAVAGAEIEMMLKSDRTDLSIEQDIRQIIACFQKEQVETEIKEKTEIYLKNPSDGLWQEIVFLKQSLAPKNDED